jgi:hypothetical protein
MNTGRGGGGRGQHSLDQRRGVWPVTPSSSRVKLRGKAARTDARSGRRVLVGRTLHHSSSAPRNHLPPPPFLASTARRRQVFGKGSGQTPLHWAAESNHAAVVERLLAASPLLGGLGDERGATPADLAAKELAWEAGAALDATAGTEWVCLELQLEDAAAGVMPQP